MVRKQKTRKLLGIAFCAGMLCFYSLILFAGTSWGQGLSGICSVGTRVFSALDYSLAFAGGAGSPQVNALIQSANHTPETLEALGYTVPSHYFWNPVGAFGDGTGSPIPIGSGVSAGPFGFGPSVPFAPSPISGFSLPAPPNFDPPTPDILR